MGMADFDTIRVFEMDPDLLLGLDERTAAHLRTRALTRLVWAERGRWSPSLLEEDPRGHMGLLLIDGLVVRTLRLADRECSEVVGPGDLLVPWCDPESSGSVSCTSDFYVLQRTRFAALDAAFAASVARWPSIAVELIRRTTSRCRSLAYQAAIAHVRHAEARLLLLLWHLADRWGSVTPQGIVVPVPLTHQLLAQLTCLQRPTVTAALGHLEQQRALRRLPGRGWLLLGEPPEMLDGQPDVLAA